MSIRQGNRVVSGNNAVLKANKSLDNITTKAEEKIVNSVINTVGANEKGLIVNSSMFDMKVTDRILSGSELAGWAIAGSTVYKSEYPDFYNACIKEYEGGFADKICMKTYVDVTGNNVLDGYKYSNIDANNYVQIPGTFAPTTSNKWEFVLSCKTGAGTASYDFISFTGNTGFLIRRFPEGYLALYASGTGSSWNIAEAVNSTEIIKPFTKYRISFSFDGTCYSLKVSEDGAPFVEYINIPKTIRLAGGTINLGIRGYADREFLYPFDGTIYLHETYMVIDGVRTWVGADVVDSVANSNNHVFYDIHNASEVDTAYKTYGRAEFYGIDTEHECIILPRPLEDENRFTYYCVGNTEVSSANIDISKEIELNNPFFLGMSKYFENTPTNASWLVSNGEFQSSAVYPAMYNYVLENVTAGTKDFARVNDTYDDYCFVLDEANQSFRLPLLNGEEKKFSDARYIDIDFSSKDVSLVAPANGWYHVNQLAGTTNAHLSVARNKNGSFASEPSYRISGASTTGTAVFTSLEVNRGEEIRMYSTATGNIQYCKFYYNTGNGTLYYYVGEAVNNANLIDTAKITTALANKVSKGSDEFDGDWIYAPKSIFSGVSFTTLDTNYTYDISEHLPNDDYDYEVQIYTYGSTAASSGKTTYLWCGTDVTGTTSYPIVRAVTRTSSAMTFVGTAVLRVGAGRTFMLRNTGTSCGSCSGSLLCYRRLGRKN